MVGNDCFWLLDRKHHTNDMRKNPTPMSMAYNSSPMMLALNKMLLMAMVIKHSAMVTMYMEETNINRSEQTINSIFAMNTAAGATAV